MAKEIDHIDYKDVFYELCDNQARKNIDEITLDISNLKDNLTNGKDVVITNNTETNLASNGIELTLGNRSIEIKGATLAKQIPTSENGDNGVSIWVEG